MIERPRTLRPIVGCLLVVTVLATVALSGVAASEYAVSTDSETDTPSRTVTIEGSTFTIDSIATAPVGDTVAASIQVPDDSSYVLDVYRNENEVVRTEYGSGPQTESLDMSGFDAGTYALVLHADGDVVDVKPLVMEGVSVTLQAPGSVEMNETATATVETSSIDGTTPQAVEVAIWNGDSTERVTATETGDGTYEATIDGLDPGDYQLYAAAQGSGTVMGEPNVVGVSDGTTLSVSDGGSNPGGGDPGGEDPGDENESGTETDGSGGDGTDGNESETGRDTGDGDGSDDGTDADGTPQQPSDPDGTGDDGGSDSIPVVGPAAVVVPLSILTWAVLRRE
ncbi:hypothetical protein [Halovivax cerinus]|uniref:Uncharacterized protein n=1 Tax=Halovivax cerinus TaxID=1487865 RepID=A0ABD5NQT5_9EURY|nr:hypothetical protein [Halovivax cerinus]